MTKRRFEVEHENTDRWLVSYADFITLLFAFFVVMYAISSVNISKYRVLSNSFESIFEAEAKTPKPIQVGHLARSPTDFTGYQNTSEGDGKYPVDEINNQIQESLKGISNQEDLSVRANEHGIEIELKDKTIFSSGGAELSKNAIPILDIIASAISPYPNAVRVEGYTDNVPIDNIFYPSNWDLSVARSASVVRYLTGAGVNPNNVAAIGFGEYQPIDTNSTAEGRRNNRRVVIVVSNQTQIRPEMIATPKSNADIEVIEPENFVGPLLPPNWTPPKLNAVKGQINQQINALPEP